MAPKPKAKPKPQSKKSSNKPRSSSITTTNTTDAIPSALQQQILTVFRTALSPALDSTLPTTLQRVKKHLYERDFAAAFGTDENLRAYAVRWSPARALAYAGILRDAVAECGDQSGREKGDGSRRCRVVCVGGGAGAEVVALGAVVKRADEEVRDGSDGAAIAVDITAVDMAAWGPVLADLYSGMVMPPPLSKYAAEHVRAANVAFLHDAEALKHTFVERDILAMDDDEMGPLLADADLITLFFTLNELYTTSMPRANATIVRIKRAMHIGAALLVVDSAGSYAEVSLNGSEKRYPMQWLLDHTLTGEGAARGSLTAGNTDNTTFEKIRSEESVWFRVPEGLRYPLELENMRYQLHMYRKTAG